MASPYQVKFCYSLQKYYDTEFWFYVRREKERPKWWEIPLGEKCKILKVSGVLPRIGYFSLGVFSEWLRFKPDIIMLGGFMNWHWLILKLAKIFNKKVIILTEPLRYVTSESDQSQSLLNKENALKPLRKINMKFTNADLFVGMGQVAEQQLIHDIGFDKNKVTWTIYPTDIEAYFSHPLRQFRQSQDYTILFANRLIDRYQPIFALEVYKVLKQKYPRIKMLMNNDGQLKQECLQFIRNENLQDVHFLEEIDSWNNMHKVYQNADILLLPATYSNGNGTIIEAAASGMGLVLSNQINDIEKEVMDGENCFICNLEIDSFVSAISKYIEEPGIFPDHGKLSRGIVEVLKNENLAKNYSEMFERYGL